MMTNESTPPGGDNQQQDLVTVKTPLAPAGENGRIVPVVAPGDDLKTFATVLTPTEELKKALTGRTANSEDAKPSRMAQPGEEIKKLQDELRRSEGRTLPPIPPLVPSSPKRRSPSDYPFMSSKSDSLLSQNASNRHHALFTTEGSFSAGNNTETDDIQALLSSKRHSSPSSIDPEQNKRSRKSSAESLGSPSAIYGSPPEQLHSGNSPTSSLPSYSDTGFLFDPALYERAKSTPSYKLHSGNGHKIGAYTLKAEQRKLERMFTCDICDRSFGYKHVLQKHQRIHSGEKPFQCKECDKRFTQEHHLKTHMRTHTGERPYACDLCPRTFAQVANLRRHKRVHTGEKPYECEVCNKRFPSSGHVKKHMRIHTGEKPYVCDICQQTFRLHHHLVDHKRIHSGEKPFHCSECSRDFSTQRGLQQHRHESPSHDHTAATVEPVGNRAKKLHAVVSKLAAEKLGKMTGSPSPPGDKLEKPKEQMPIPQELNPALHGSFFYHGLPTQVRDLKGPLGNENFQQRRLEGIMHSQLYNSLLSQMKIPSLLGSPVPGAIPVSMAPFFNPYLLPLGMGATFPTRGPQVVPLPSESESDVEEVITPSDESDLEEGEVRRPRKPLEKGKTSKPNGSPGQDCGAVDYSLQRRQSDGKEDWMRNDVERRPGAAESNPASVIVKSEQEDPSLLKLAALSTHKD